MDTDDLIRRLALDAKRPIVPLAAAWWAALTAAVVVAAIVFFVSLGPRQDFIEALQTPRFLFKFVFTTSLAAGAFLAARALSRPDDRWREAISALAMGPMPLLVAVIAELFLLPPALWPATTIGKNSMVCLTYIPLIGIVPLSIFLAVLRHGATARPTLAGAVTGILAGAIAATFYAAQCTDDSPLFVATWYTIAIAGLAAIGAIGANVVARW